MTALLPQFATRRVDDDIEHLIDTIQHADALDLLARLPDASVDMVLCDLPYQVTQNSWDVMIPLGGMWNNLHRICKERSAIVFTAMQPFTSLLVSSNMKMFRDEWIWRKSNGTGFLDAKNRPMRNHESILVFSRKRCDYYPQMREGDPYRCFTASETANYGKFDKIMTISTGERYPLTVLEFASDKGLHPTQKPVALFEYLIKTYTQEGDIVLDFTSGSGTTAVAARKCGRRFICGDNHLPYVELARERLQRTDPYRATPLENGQTQLSLFEAAS